MAALYGVIGESAPMRVVMVLHFVSPGLIAPNCMKRPMAVSETVRPAAAGAAGGGSIEYQAEVNGMKLKPMKALVSVAKLEYTREAPAALLYARTMEPLSLSCMRMEFVVVNVEPN